MTETAAPDDLHARVLELARAGEISAVEEHWLEIAENPPTDPQFYAQWIKWMVRAEAQETTHSLLILALDTVESKQQWTLSLQIIETAAATFPESQKLRPYTARALKASFADHPNLQQLLATCKGVPLDRALKRFRELLKYSAGEVYGHAYWGEGVVRSLDLTGNTITLDFPAEPNKTLKLDFFQKHLTWLEPNSFRARRARTPDELREFCFSNPTGCIRLALADGKKCMKQSELKAMLTPGVLDEDEWSGWWNKAREAIKSDPMIDFSTRGGAHAEVALRDTPRSMLEEIEQRFFHRSGHHAPSVDSRREAIARLAKSIGGGETDGARPLARRMLDQLLAEYRADSNAGAATQLERAFLAEDILDAAPELGADSSSFIFSEPMLAKMDGLEQTAAFTSAEYSVRAVRRLIERMGNNASQAAADFLPRAPMRIAQEMWKSLEDEQHHGLAAHAIHELFENSVQNSETFLWALKQLTEKKWPHLADDFPASWLVATVLEKLVEWKKVHEHSTMGDETVQAAARLITRAQALLQARHFAAVTNAIEAVPLDQAQRLRREIANSPVLNDLFKSGAERQILLARRELQPSSSGSSSQSASGEENFFFCTPKARNSKVGELRELNTVKIPHNNHEIEVARAEGDLKENAGYIFAKEKQKLLAQQSLQLQQALQKARVFGRDKVRSDVIGFGVKFEARNEASGTIENFTVLGPFESDPDHHIFSYQAPLIQQFLNKRVGDAVTVRQPDGAEANYNIQAITDILAGGDWEAE